LHDTRVCTLGRQKVGIAAAKAEGKYTGCAPTAQAKAVQVLKLHAKGLTKDEIAKAYEIGIASVYRILKASSVAKIATTTSN